MHTPVEDAVIELREAVATMAPVKPVLDDVEAGFSTAVGISVTFQVGNGLRCTCWN